MCATRSAGAPAADRTGEPRERSRGELAWARIYALMKVVDQVVVDGGSWKRGFPLLFIEDVPHSADRSSTASLTPTPMSRLVSRAEAAILVSWQREMKALAGKETAPPQPTGEPSARAKARAKKAAAKAAEKAALAKPPPAKAP